MPLARSISGRREAECLGLEALPGVGGGMPRARGVPGKAGGSNASGWRHFQAGGGAARLGLKACPEGGVLATRGILEAFPGGCERNA